MGLDMYAYAFKESQDLKDVDQNLDALEAIKSESDDTFGDEFFYWRKNHDLHGWMEQLYRRKGGTADFNCVSVRLYKTDLMDLKAAIIAKRLPETSGFFFGNYPPNDESNSYDLEFVSKALDEIEKGHAIYYTSWW